MSKVSCVTCHVSCVRCHMSPVTCKKKKKITFSLYKKKWHYKNIGQCGGASRWRVCCEAVKLWSVKLQSCEVAKFSHINLAFLQKIWFSWYHSDYMVKILKQSCLWDKSEYWDWGVYFARRWSLFHWQLAQRCGFYTGNLLQLRAHLSSRWHKTPGQNNIFNCFPLFVCAMFLSCLEYPYCFSCQVLQYW